MNIITLPVPPRADDPNFNARVVDWMSAVKSTLEIASRANDSPIGQQFQVGAFTTNTSIAGASVLGDVANCLASLITAMTSKGLITPIASRTNG